MKFPSIDEVCESIIANGAVEAREWVASRPDDDHGKEWIGRTTRPYYDAGAERCYLGGLGETGESDEVDFENIVVQLPDDFSGRRTIYKLLCDHLCERVDSCENSEAYLEKPDRYWGERYCLLRFDELITDPEIP